MTLDRTSWAGFLVVVTACLVTLGLAATACTLYLQGQLDAAKDASLQFGTAFSGTLALLAVTGGRGNTEPVPVKTGAGDGMTIKGR